MKSPSLLKMVSALKRKTEPMVPTEGPIDGQTAGDIETGYEDALRGLSPRGSVSDVLRRREEQYKPPTNITSKQFDDRLDKARDFRETQKFKRAFTKNIRT